MDYFNDFKIVQVAKMITNRSSSLTRYPCGAIGVMLRDSAILCRENLEVEIKTPFLYWVRPNTPMCWQTPPGNTRENLWLAANGPRLNRMMDSLDKISSNGYIFLEKTVKIVFVLEEMRKLFEHNTLYDRRRLPLMAEELMLEIQEALIEDDISGRMISIIHTVAREMAEHPENQFDIELITRNHKISPDYFRHCFQQYIGTSFHDYLLKQRYAMAIRLLRETPLNITEIAERCTFTDQSLFTRFFKKRSGVSPSEFRKHIY